MYLVLGTYILFVPVLSRKGSFGLQVLDRAVLFLSACIDHEDGVPLVVFYNGAHNLLFERSELLIATSQKKGLCVCARLILVLEEKTFVRVRATNLGFRGVRKTLLV